MADPRERMRSWYVTLSTYFRARQAGIYTAYPASVIEYTPGEMTVSAQITIQGQQRQPGGKWNYLTLPQCIHCPVVLPRGGGFVMTFPLAVGDEGLLVFASRCVDNWWKQGGVQSQAELRMHDISDGFFIPGCFSQPNVPSGVSTNSVRIQSTDGTKFMEFTAAGDLHVTGEVYRGWGGADQVSLGSHVHGGVQAGAAVTQKPTAGT